MAKPIPTPDSPTPDSRKHPAQPQVAGETDKDEERVDRASEDSFPASDPPSYTPVTHSGEPRHDTKKP